MTPLRDLMRREPRYGFALPAWLDRLLSAGIVTNDPQVARRQRCVNVAAYAGAISGASYILLTSLYDARGLLLLNAYNALLVVAGILLPRLHRFGENVAGLALAMLVALGQLYVIWMLGITSDLHVFFVLAGAALFFFGVQNWKLFLAVFVFGTALLLFALNFAPIDGLLLPTDGRLRDIVSAHTMLSVVVINAAIIFYALTLVQRAEAELEQQHERSEALIATVMPEAIAARLKSSDARIADHIDNLSVVFADLVGFTSAAHDLPPEEIVGFLDSLVRRFRRARRAARRGKDQNCRRLLHGGGRFRRACARRRDCDRAVRACDAGGKRRARTAWKPQTGTARRGSLRPRDRRRHRRYAFLLRCVGRLRERRLAHGIARGAGPHPGERGVPSAHRGGVRLRRTRRDGGPGYRSHAHVFSDGAALTNCGDHSRSKNG